MLQTFGQERNLSQRVRKPTRGEYLLDLVMTDIEPMKIDHLSTIADHQLLLIQCPITMQLATIARRQVWDFARANWKQFNEDLRKYDWSFLDDYDFIHTDDAAECFSRHYIAARCASHPEEICTRI